MSIRCSLLKLALLLSVIGILCLAAFQLIGSSVDQDGFLHEPFALIPIGWLFIISGAIVGVIHAVLKGLRSSSGRRN